MIVLIGLNYTQGFCEIQKSVSLSPSQSGSKKFQTTKNLNKFSNCDTNSDGDSDEFLHDFNKKCLSQKSLRQLGISVVSPAAHGDVRPPIFLN